MNVGGLVGGYAEDNLVRLASLAKRYKVEKIWIESNFGDGMFDKLLTPVLGKIYPCTIEEVRSSKQKELRIIDTIEPLLNQHRLVFSKQLLVDDIKEALSNPTRMPYSLVYQLTHITKDRGCLRHDDRLDALAIVLAAIVEMMAVDEDEAVSSWKEEQLKETLDAWVDSNKNSRWFSSGGGYEDTGVYY
jgi:hypothetical protein